MEWLLVLVLLFVISTYYDKWKKAGPIEGRGLKGIAMTYFRKISYLARSLPDDAKKHILEEAYYVIKKYQQEYNPNYDDEFLHYLFNDKYKDSVREECFALSFLLCNRIRHYPSDDLGYKMAITYYEDLEKQLGNLYDYCYMNDVYFPGRIVDCFCLDGYRILEENSEHFKQNQK